MKKYTVENIMSWGPCSEYTRRRVEKLFADHAKHCNEYDVAGLPISSQDKGWLLGKMLPWDKNFVFPESVTDLWVYSNPGLTELTVPESVTDLRVYSNPGLTELTVPESVTHLWVDSNPGLTELTVPESVTHLWVDNNPGLTGKYAG